MRNKPQKTYDFIIVAKFTKADLLKLGPGVLLHQKVTFTDQHNKGFDSVQFKRELEKAKQVMLNSYIDVLYREEPENGNRIIKLN